jgi:hypothetical protein
MITSWKLICFLGAFTDKVTVIVYHNNTGKLTFTLLLGCVCLFVLYHYKANTILATNMEDATFFAAYKDTCKYYEVQAKAECNEN